MGRFVISDGTRRVTTVEGPGTFAFAVGAGKSTCLHAAARNEPHGAKELVPLMLALLGTEVVGLSDDFGKSAIIVALECQQQDVALLLVDAADTESLQASFRGENLLHLASRMGLTQVARKLLDC